MNQDKGNSGFILCIVDDNVVMLLRFINSYMVTMMLIGHGI